MAFKSGYGTVVVSMSDLIRHPWYDKYKDKPKGIEALLFSMGMDTSYPYESEVLTHRSTMTNEIVNCERFVGSKRQDESWLKIERMIGA